MKTWFQTQSIRNKIIVVIITAYATVDTAVEAMKLGAYDYLTKPVDPDDIGLLIARALEHVSLSRENIALKMNIEVLQGDVHYCSIVQSVVAGSRMWHTHADGQLSVIWSAAAWSRASSS